MSLVDAAARGAERGRRPTPELIGGDVLEGEEPDGPADHAGGGAGRGRRPARADRDPHRCGRRRCASIPARSASPAAGSIPSDDGPVAAALREAEEEIGLPPAAVEVIGARRPLPHRHRLRGDAGRRPRAARSAARPNPDEVARSVRGAAPPSARSRPPDDAQRASGAGASGIIMRSTMKAGGSGARPRR